MALSSHRVNCRANLWKRLTVSCKIYRTYQLPQRVSGRSCLIESSKDLCKLKMHYLHGVSNGRFRPPYSIYPSALRQYNIMAASKPSILQKNPSTMYIFALQHGRVMVPQTGAG